MKRIFQVTILIVSLFILINNYQDGIDVNYPLEQLAITIMLLGICYLMYKVIGVKIIKKNKL
jgi:hypothetical protein